MSAEPTTEHLQTVLELSDIVMDPTTPFAERLERALAAGSDHLGFAAGFLTAIDLAAERQEILHLTRAAGGLEEGVVVPLSESYCRETVASESGTATVTDATAEGWADDPAYQRFGLESYAGAVLEFDDDRRGTLCFAGDEPYSGSLDETTVGVVALLARWASYELAVRTGCGAATGNGVVASFADPLDRDAVDTALDLLSNRLRRDLLVHLARRDGPVGVSEVAASLASSSDDRTESPERVEIELVHGHIPRLRQAGVVSLDEQTRELAYHPTDALGRLLGQVGLCEGVVTS